MDHVLGTRLPIQVSYVKSYLNYMPPPQGLIYDPFMGSGTTAVACKHLNLNCIGSEISENQVEWAKERIEKEVVQTSLFDPKESLLKALSI